jgi:hypothetical protein
MREIEIVDGVAGNARITGIVSVLLLLLLLVIAEAATIPLIGRLRGPHILIGMLLLGPLALKLPSTGYRFAPYYARTPAYVQFLHKLSFIVWVAFVSVHILGHLFELPRLATPDWRRSAPEVFRLAGAGPRILLLACAVTAGLALGFLGLSVAGSWLS